jgi:hypothetical protein
MNDELLKVNVNVELTARSLQTIVANAKKMNKADDRGIYRIDTADMVSDLITRFLQEKEFEKYVENSDLYGELHR